MTPLPEAVVRGAAHFDRGEYFEAHEAWEGHWGLGPPAERALTLGLIKAAVALHHLSAGNVRGFEWQLEKALPLLRENANVWPELDAARLAEELDGLAVEARFKGAALGESRPRLGVQQPHRKS
ncbi:MAG: DUF309 domain-containing protein [Thermoplasmatota archaeon]